MNCRHCGTALEHVFLDLGFSPRSNAYLKAEDLSKPEVYFPLKLYVCDNCWLVQTEDHASADELFSDDYAYFSSVSQSWLDHATDYFVMIQKRLGLGPDSLVIEIASNDGYLLRNFVTSGIPCLGIEPTASTAEAAEKLGIPVMRRFFGTELAQELVTGVKLADLIIGNNVYAHVPDINDFTAGLKSILKPGGTVTLEFPHLLQLIEETQFDTVYHEHFSYLSLYTVARVFAEAGLRVFDVEALKTHGGSLRVYGCHSGDERPATDSIRAMLEVEEAHGLRELETYLGFQAHADKVRDDLLAFLKEEKRSGKSVVAYGAAAKGNTLLNYAGIKPDMLPYVCDAASSKQGKYLPGSHIPVRSPAVLIKHNPDVVLILPWNIADEIIRQHGYVLEWGGVFVTAIPDIRVIS